MIFVTVGTHEQPFDRLVAQIDRLKADGVLEDEVIIQTGFCTYAPRHCRCEKLFPYPEMQELIARARIVVTHGGPASFLSVLQAGKIPVVVPRQKQFNEHVNDHQLQFCREVARRQKNILLAEDMDALKDALVNYDRLNTEVSATITDNNARFCAQLQTLVDDLFAK